MLSSIIETKKKIVNDAKDSKTNFRLDEQTKKKFICNRTYLRTKFLIIINHSKFENYTFQKDILVNQKEKNIFFNEI